MPSQAPTSYSTDQILESLAKKAPIPDTQQWADEVSFSDRTIIHNDIIRSCQSLSRCANLCSVSTGHLSDFLSGKKNMGRDALLRIFLTLGYDLATVNRYLLHLNQSSLYVRDKRDYLIADAINRKFSLDQLNELLFKNQLETLSPEK